MVSLFNFNEFCKLLFKGLILSGITANSVDDLKNVTVEIHVELRANGYYDGSVDGVGMHIGEGWIPGEGWDVEIVGSVVTAI